jgi:cytochrome oxidase Cu insertion factor (SCO1/SenC/PrrC family)
MRVRPQVLHWPRCWPAAAGAHPPPQRSAAQLMDVLMWNREPIGGPFALVDHQGKRRTDKDFRGKMLLVYFGFTSCVDVCPTDLQNIGLALPEAGAKPEGHPAAVHHGRP